MKGKLKNIGVQLYTLRAEMNENLQKTLERVASIGFKEVEFAGYFEKKPRDIRLLLDELGITAPAAHIVYQDLGSPLAETIENAQQLGHLYLVNPWIDAAIRERPDGWKRIAEIFNRAGEQCKQAGIQFCYHNHHFEFVPLNGVLPYDILLQECDADLVKMELDLCWITLAGKDPEDYFLRYPSRFPLVHLKQLKRLPKQDFRVALSFDQVFTELSEVGPGVIDWKQQLSLSSRAGVQHYFVEHDVAKLPFDSIQQSYRYLSELNV
ncbi:sugar phosphate isomerase/epimerase [Iodobacter sp. LRB]|uniref:sugar phosphate isomerase/epimerase family protein n=1 Tax=unclassified Iodobacter TaxID=235634 RepID=UPI000C0CD33F|nr:sugar phosphate isomerase/epimerase [Iodobacter sp. BJB302]PHV00612.1 xylose isomerase [Iodobacter sp. BJB302]